MRILSVAILALCFISGCGSDNGSPPHTADEQKALDEYNKLTPEQKIQRAENAPMDRGAKDALIKKIKEENGIK